MFGGSLWWCACVFLLWIMKFLVAKYIKFAHPICYHRNDGTVLFGMGVVNRANVFFGTHTRNQAQSKKGGEPHDRNHINNNPSVGISANITQIVIQSIHSFYLSKWNCRLRYPAASPTPFTWNTSHIREYKDTSVITISCIKVDTNSTNSVISLILNIC